MFLVATGNGEQVFYVIDPEENDYDGVVVREDRIVHVPFWSYTSRETGLTPVLASELSRELWDGKAARSNPNWSKKFVTREIPFTEDELFSIEFLLVPVPDEREPAEER